MTSSWKKISLFSRGGVNVFVKNKAIVFFQKLFENFFSIKKNIFFIFFKKIFENFWKKNLEKKLFFGKKVFLVFTRGGSIIRELRVLCEKGFKRTYFWFSFEVLQCEKKKKTYIAFSNEQLVLSQLPAQRFEFVLEIPSLHVLKIKKRNKIHNFFQIITTVMLSQTWGDRHLIKMAFLFWVKIIFWLIFIFYFS